MSDIRKDKQQKEESSVQTTEHMPRGDSPAEKMHQESQGLHAPAEEHGHKKKKKDKDVHVSREQLQELQDKARELDTLKDNFLRKIADFENAKKRLIKEKEDFVKFANEKIIASFLEVLDNLERAISHGNESNQTEGLLQGVTLIKKQIDDILTSNGLVKIEALGKPFDPHIHEAVGIVHTTEQPADTVFEEVQCGYLLKGKLLRPSWVRVTGTPPADDVVASGTEATDEADV